jgi:hypothetical protein
MLAIKNRLNFATKKGGTSTATGSDLIKANGTVKVENTALEINTAGNKMLLRE